MVPPPRGVSSGLFSPEEEQEEVLDMVSLKGQRGTGSTDTQSTARKSYTPRQSRKKPSSGAWDGKLCVYICIYINKNLPHTNM